MRSKSEFISLVKQFIFDHALGALATVKPSGSPEVASVEFIAFGDNDLQLGFCTLNDWGYRKYAYLKQNKNIAIVFTDQNITVQLEGIAKEVNPNGDVREALDKKFPDSADFLKLPQAKFFEVQVNWARYADFKDNQPPFDIEEMSF